MATDRQYPIGRFEYTGPYTPAQRDEFIARIAALPEALRDAVAGMTDEQLDTPYRDGGWTVRQVIHHLADSHMHCYLRFKFALAEDGAEIKAYPEDAWAALPDVGFTPLGQTLDLLGALHGRWALLLQHMGDADYARAFLHPENGRTPLDRALGLYAWHGDHHLAHVRLVAEG